MPSSGNAVDRQCSGHVSCVGRSRSNEGRNAVTPKKCGLRSLNFGSQLSSSHHRARYLALATWFAVVRTAKNNTFFLFSLPPFGQFDIAIHRGAQGLLQLQHAARTPLPRPVWCRSFLKPPHHECSTAPCGACGCHNREGPLSHCPRSDLSDICVRMCPCPELLHLPALCLCVPLPQLFICHYPDCLQYLAQC